MTTNGGDRRSTKGYVNETFVTHDGRTQSVKAWAKELGLSQNAMSSRVKNLHAGKYTVEQALGKDRLPRGYSAHGAQESIRRKPLSELMLEMVDVPYEQDEFARTVVAMHRGEGLELDRIGELYGLTRERVRQVEQTAMRKIRNALGRDKSAREIIETLRAIDQMRRPNTNACVKGGACEGGEA